MNPICYRPLPKLVATRLVATRLALIAALVATLGLAACGRKGPLDPPPGASLAGDQSDAKYGSPVRGPDNKPLAPPGPNKRIPLDVLLN